MTTTKEGPLYQIQANAKNKRASFEDAAKALEASFKETK